MGIMTRKYRPGTFEEVIGQPLAVKILRAVAKNPERSANSMVLSGPWGTGKTTLARIFGKALSCENFQKTGKICLKCRGCQQWDTVSNRYIEYDSSMVGNVNQIRDLKPVFEMVTDFYRVIVLDEAQLISRQAQAACLKVIEEGSPKTFFVLCSTDPDMILDTIHSRSLPVDFFKVDGPVIKTFLKEIYEKETGKTDISDDILSKIAFKSDGHVRDAVMLMEGYMVSNDEAVLALPLDDIAEFLLCLGNNDGRSAIGIVRHKIMKHPTHQIQKSLNYLVMQLVSSHVMGSGQYLNVAQSLGERSMMLFRLVSENWVQGVFNDKYLTVSFFLSLVKQFVK